MDDALAGDSRGKSAKENMRPDFGRSGDVIKSSNLEAGKALGAAEDGALKTDSNETSNAKDLEESGGFFTGNGRVAEAGRNARRSLMDVTAKGTHSIAGRMKKKGPIFWIVSLIFGTAGIMGVTQMFQPFSLVAQFMETFNSMHTSVNRRSNVFFYRQMGTGKIKNPIKASIFGDKFTISKKQASELAKQGIEFEEKYKFPDGTEAKVLKYKNGVGDDRIVVADEKLAAKLRDGGAKNVLDFKAAYAGDNNFFSKYNSGSMTWRGQVSNWFGSMTNKFLRNNKLNRNKFKNYNEEKAKNGGDGMKATKELLAKGTDTLEDGGIRRGGKEADENGEGKIDGRNPEKSSTKRKNIDVNAKMNKIKGTISGAANYACAALDTVAAITLLVTANEALQIINLTMGYFEAVDKVKAGYGDDSPINELGNALNERVVTENTVFVDGSITYSDNGETRTSNLTTEKVSSVPKSAMESAGIAALYGNGKVDLSDPSVQSFNISSSIGRIFGGIGVSIGAFSTCLTAKIAAATANLAADVAAIAACFTLIGCAGLVGKLGLGVAAGVAAGVVIAGIIAVVTPWATSVLERDLISTLAGVDFGNALTSGGNMYLGNIHKTNGGSLSTEDEYKKFAVAQQQVIAENARLERTTLSPFDITSKYTFMGSLLTRIMGLTTSNSLMSTLSTGGSVMSSSVVALLPSASALEIVDTLPNKYDEYEQTCPFLYSIGAVGDVFCNPYMITDVSTIDMDPEDVLVEVSKGNNFESKLTSDGNVVIDKNSDLAKYIKFCGERTSVFGIADQNIISAFSVGIETNNVGVNTVSNSIIGSVPILGDALDIVGNTNVANNLGYVSGKSCVAGGDNEGIGSEAPDWNKAKYYQRFIEDQSLAESMGIIEKSAVTAYLEEYYEENPLDNSYEGILARYSGLSKDTVADVLDIIEYGNYIANYHPEERFAFGAPAVRVEDGLNFDNDNKLANNYFVLFEQISFADVRNRSFAI